MESNLSKLWLVAFSGLAGAIAGAWIWAQRAAAVAQQAAQKIGEDDALIETARTVGTNSLAASLQGAFFGALLGVAAAFAYFYFTNPDRGMIIRKVDTNDNY